MADVLQWIEGARPRTLPVNIAPVVAGCGLAGYAGEFVWWKALLCLVVAMALQVGVNYANDYSDGVRGTDADRVGPLRLVGSGAATAGAVRTAAFTAFGIAASAGLGLALTSEWWLVFVGGASIAAAWFYTGGSSPYGYHALGEVGVFVFFGLVAVSGTAYVQTGQVSAPVLWTALGIGAFACAVLVANNLRDIPTDARVGKRTLAVVLGDRRSRWLYETLVVAGYLALVPVAVTTTGWALLGFAVTPLSAHAALVVRRGATGAALVPVLRDTGLGELWYAIALTVGLLIG